MSTPISSQSCFIDIALLQKISLLLGHEKSVVYSKLVNNPFKCPKLTNMTFGLADKVDHSKNSPIILYIFIHSISHGENTKNISTLYEFYHFQSIQ